MESELKNNVLKSGTTILGIVCKDGIVMASDRRSTAGTIVMSKNVQKTVKINDYLVISGTGNASDIEMQKKLIAAELKLKELRSKKRPTVREAANLIAMITYRNIRQPAMIPSIVGTLVGGFNEDGTTELYTIEPAGTAMKAPPSSVAYESLAYPTGSVPDSIHYLVLPNPKLKPENFTAYEFSINRRILRHIDFELSIYYNTIRNLINYKTVIACPDTLPLSVTDSVFTKTNERTAKSILFGGQILLSWNNIISKIKLNASLSLTYNADQSKNFSFFNEITNVFQLTPKHYGQFRLAATPFKNLYIQIDNTWMTEWMRLFTQKDFFEDITGYYTIDLLVNYNIGINLQAFIRCNNLLNEKYATPGIIHSDMQMISTPQPGRNIRAGLSYMLN